ncbi:MAG: hypothetical protein WBG46_14700 [Nonlabens sp.]
MNAKSFLRTTLVWLPSVILLLIYLPNAFGKIFDPVPLDKVIQSKTIMVATGIFMILGCLLFIYSKTIIIGTAMLSLYMVCISFIHFMKGKPHEVVVLIVIATIFAAYIRRPGSFGKNIIEHGN